MTGSGIMLMHRPHLWSFKRPLKDFFLMSDLSVFKAVYEALLGHMVVSHKATGHFPRFTEKTFYGYLMQGTTPAYARHNNQVRFTPASAAMQDVPGKTTLLQLIQNM